MRFATLVNAILLIWFILEYFRGLARSREPGRSSYPRSSGSIFFLLLICFLVSIFVRQSDIGDWTLPAFVEWLGVAMLLFGIIFRQYAMTVLGRYFSAVIRIQEGHQLVQSGPYGYIRHPTYTGMLLAFYGAGLALGNWIIFLTFIILPTLALLLRIKAEEKMLETHFGEEYREYRKKTKKLLPFIY